MKKRKHVYKLWWNGECIDYADTKQEAYLLRKEYRMAYHDGNITVKGGYVYG